MHTTVESLKPAYTVELVKEGRAHFYKISGTARKYPGVTGILGIINKPALVPWAKREALSAVEDALLKRLNGKDSARVKLDKAWIDGILADAKKRPDAIKDEAAGLGTQAHAFIDKIIHGQEPEAVPPEIDNPVKAFKDWWRGSGIELVMGDTKVASCIHGYGGSLDAVGVRDGKYIVLDWKTSSGIYKEYALQVAAYVQAFRETYGVSCDAALIARFSKKTPVEFEVEELMDPNQTLSAFLAAKELKAAMDRPHYLGETK